MDLEEVEEPYLEEVVEPCLEEVVVEASTQMMEGRALAGSCWWWWWKIR